MDIKTTTKIYKPLPMGSVIPISQAQDTGGTIFDSGIKLDRIGRIDLPVQCKYKGKQLTSILVPYIGVETMLDKYYVLPKHYMIANMIILAIKDRSPDLMLQSLVTKYYISLEETLENIKSRNIDGFRVTCSGRFVITPSPTLKHTEVAIPSWIMSATDITSETLVLVTRSPVLWEGSVIIQQPVPINGHAGAINPYIMKLLGADFDGDTVAVIRIPMSAQAEARKHLGKLIEAESKWPPEFLMLDKNKDINWDTYKEDAAIRIGIEDAYMYTISPEDLLHPDKSDIIQNMIENDCKSLPDDLSKFIKGYSQEEYEQIMDAEVQVIIKTKSEIGFIGAATDILLQDTAKKCPDRLKFIFRLKEALTQRLLNSKHGEKQLDTQRTSRLLRTYKDWTNKDVEETAEILREAGMKEDIIKEAIDTICLLPKT